jgi:light-harvesting protein B-800-850 alpha chain
MNQGRIWCVVNPTVGLPLLIGSVAVTSLIVHYSILSHTPWMSSYWSGAKKTAELEGTTAPVALNSTSAPAFVVTVAPSASGDAKASSFVINVAPATVSTADASAPTTLAAVTPAPN